MKRRESERGFALLVVFLLAAAIALMLYQQIPRVAFESERDKEELLIQRGEQYKRAIQLYFVAFKKYPSKLEDLENTNEKRFLRRRYIDPMTGKDEWRLVHTNGAGVLTDSLVQKPPGADGLNNKGTSTFGSSDGALGSGSSSTATPAPDKPPEINAAALARPSDRPLTSPQGLQPGAQSNPAQANNNGFNNNPFPGNNQFPGNNPFPGNNQVNQNGVDPNDPRYWPPISLTPPTPAATPGQNGQPAFNQQFPGQQFPGQQFPGQQPNPGQQLGGQPLPGQQFPFGQQPGQLQPNPFGNAQQFPVQQPFPIQPPANDAGQQLPGQFNPQQMVSQQLVQQLNPQGQQQNAQPFPGAPGFPPQQNFNPSPFPVQGGVQPGAQNGLQPTGSGQNGAFGNIPENPTSPFPGGAPFPNSPGGFPAQPPNGFPPQPPNGFNPAALPGQQPGAGQQNGAPGSNPALNAINDMLRTPRQAPNAPAANAPANAGGLAGVASTFTGPSIKRYNERSKFEEWEFIFDLKQGLPGQPAPNSQNQNGQNGNQQNPTNPAQPSTPIQAPSTSGFGNSFSIGK
jgi:hypothetical protein